MSGDEEKRRDEGLQNPVGGAGKSALESAEGHVARSTGASRQAHESGNAFAHAFKALLEWGEASGLIRPESDFPFLKRFPDGHGNEHECWFDESSNRWLKATFANRFGLAWGRDGTATPAEYLKRLILQNRYFGDDIRLIALVNCDGRLRVLTSQPHIFGEPATGEEIRKWFIDLGFACLESEGRVAWYRTQENILVADAHEGNIIKIKSTSTVLVPIDLNIIQPENELLEWVRYAIHPGNL
jgi:hypothetical protein